MSLHRVFFSIFTVLDDEVHLRLVPQQLILQDSGQAPGEVQGFHALQPQIPVTMWGPRSIAKLVHITPITMVYGAYNELITGAFVNNLITGGPHIVQMGLSFYKCAYISYSRFIIKW